MRIDSHQHFWKYTPQDYPWIDQSMEKIRQNHLPEDLKPHLDAHGIDGCITVQCCHSESESDFLLDLADQHDFIKGVVGWVDLRADDVEQKLEHYSGNPNFKGVRHVAQSEPKGFLLDSKFIRGITALTQYNLTYDVLIFPHQLKEALDFVRLNPKQAFVIDHLAKPYIKNGLIDDWKVDMQKIAKMPNVSCKVSGMVTEADWSNWTVESFFPYLDVLLNVFGIDRVMFGSDWPVCNVAARYDQVIEIVEMYGANFTNDEKSKLFGLNAKSFYNIGS